MRCSYFIALALATVARTSVRAEDGFGEWDEYGYEDEDNTSPKAAVQGHLLVEGYASGKSHVPVVKAPSGRCEPEYLGCFPDVKADRALSYFAGRVHSPSQCALLCAHHAANLVAKSESKEVKWEGSFALQSSKQPTHLGIECWCGYHDSDHTKHALEGATCLVKRADGVCSSWYDTDGTVPRYTKCAPCPYPHDLDQCGGANANSVYRVAHCGGAEASSANEEGLQQTLSALQTRHDARKSHTIDCAAPVGSRERPRTHVLRKRGCVANVHGPNSQAWAHGAESGIYVGYVNTPWECAYSCERNGQNRATVARRNRATAAVDTLTSFGIEGGGRCYCIDPTLVSFLPSGLEQAAALRGAPNDVPPPSSDYILCDTMMCAFGDEYCGGKNHMTAYDIVDC